MKMNHHRPAGNSGKNQRERSGFTLIELLVVIAIIAILAAILFPVFARARENARRSSCQSNLKQVGLGILQYTQDYDEKYPYGIQNSSGWKGLGWAGTIYPYTKSAQVLVCPSDTAQPASATVTPVSYAFSANIASQSLAVLNAPAKTVIFVEVGGAMANATVAGEGGLSSTYASPATFGDNLVAIQSDGQNPRVADSTVYRYMTGYKMAHSADANYTNGSARHFDGSNFAFADGHVKFLKPTSVEADNTGAAGTKASDTTLSAAFNPG